MSKTFVIAEAACTWLHAGLEGAYKSIEAAKACGADAWKTQWTSDPEAMAMRRGVARDKYTRLGWAQECLPKLKAKCDEVGIEFLCTVFIEKDIAMISPYVKRFKISAFESRDKEFINAITPYSNEGCRPKIISVNDGNDAWWKGSAEIGFYTLRCVSHYPTNPEELRLSVLGETMAMTWPTMEHSMCRRYDGLSDHTGHVLTGAVAVGAGARIIEAHVRMSDTPSSDPDFGHSHVLNMEQGFPSYVKNIRLAESML